MKKIEKKDIWLFLVQAVVWTLVLTVLPLATFLSTRNWETTSTSLLMVWQILRGPLIVYFANFYLFGPYLFFRRKFWWFALSNLLLIVGVNYGFFFSYLMIKEYAPSMTSDAWIGFFSGAFLFVLLNMIMGAIAIGILHFIRVRKIRQQLQEEKAKNTEAELARLKSQINPHFLFNTLDNISSLTQIDSDAAQNAIAQLSDLLRYAMYETDKSLVPLKEEVSFMQNYIDLMRLRHNERLTVTTEWPDLSPLTTPHSPLTIPPLLFISLVENAFKHGVSSSRDSFIRIRLSTAPDSITFCCENTNYPKDDQNRSGSGIGIENTRRRLELMYPGRYTWNYGVNDDGSEYSSCITINCKSKIANT